MPDLTREERISVLTGHEKNLNFNAYNLSVSIIEENAKTVPDTSSLTRINVQISDVNRQLAAVAAELVIVEALPA